MTFEELLYSLLIYAATFIVSCGCVSLSKNKSFRGFFSILAIIVPSITAAFREGGIDYEAYKAMYLSIRRGSGYETIEPLWYHLNKIMPSYEWLLFISAAIFLGMAYYAICKFTKERRTLAWYIILTVCYSTFYNGMRQMIAVSIVFAAIALLYERKYIRGFGLIAVAVLFHESAIFLLVIPIYLLLSKKFKNIEWLVVFLTAFFIFGTPIITAVLQRLGLYASYTEETSWNMSLGFILYTLPPLIPFFMYRKQLKDNKLLTLCYNLYLLIIPFQFLGMSMKYADRVMLYFLIFIAILVPLFIQEIAKKQGKNDWGIIYTIWFTIHYVILNAVLNGNGTYPYMFFN